MSRDRAHDVALSFASEQRAYVERVAARLKMADVPFFYDANETAEMWGEDLAVHLGRVYRQAQYTVVFISKEYAAKAWTRHEFRNATAKAVLEQVNSILPVR